MSASPSAPEPSFLRRYRPIVIAFFILLAGVLAWAFLPGAPADEPPGGKALVGGPFTLTDQTGQQVTEQSYRGRYMLVFFGYTFCPDICPTELQTMSEAMDLLPKAVAAKIQPIFITVDPARDTVPVMAEYVKNFTPTLVGLTGTEDQIKAASRAYRVYYQKAGDADDPNYLMDHSAIIFLMGPKGDYLSHFSVGVDGEAMARKLQEIVK